MLLAGLLVSCNQQIAPNLWTVPRDTDDVQSEIARLDASPTRTQEELQRQFVLLLHLDTPDAAILAYQLYNRSGTIPGLGPVLLAAFRHPTPEVRANAARFVGLKRIHGFEKLLRKAVSDREESVRVAALRALGILQDKSARFSMLLALKDGSWNVRAEAAEALLALGDPSTVRYLLREVPDHDDFVQMQLENAVLGLATPTTEGLLKTGLKAPPKSRSRLCALALARIGNSDGLEVLFTELRSADPWRKMDLAQAIASVSPDSATARFPDLLQNAALDPGTMEWMQQFLNTENEQPDPE